MEERCHRRSARVASVVATESAASSAAVVVATRSMAGSAAVIDSVVAPESAAGSAAVAILVGFVCDDTREAVVSGGSAGSGGERWLGRLRRHGKYRERLPWRKAVARWLGSI